MTILEEIKDIEQVLFDHKFDSYKFDTKAIMRESLMMSDAEIIAKYNEEMPKKAHKKAMKMLRLRLWHMPLAYITGKQGFMKMEFNVGRGVLIPRSDTEIVVEKAIEKYKELNNNDEVNREGLILDMCTGSGCIALSIAKEFPNSKVIGVDISKRALKFAKSNKELNKIENCEFMRSDLFEAFKEGYEIKDEWKGKFDMIISNPPYISNKDYKALEPNVKWYEPKLALCAGKWNLDFYKTILNSARYLLKDGGILVFEIDNKLRSVNQLEEFFEYFGFTDPEIFKDYNRHDRVMIGYLKKKK